MKKSRITSRVLLGLIFTLTVMCILMVTLITAALIILALFHFGILKRMEGGANGLILLLFLFIAASLLTGAVVTAITSRFPLKPFHILINGLKSLTEGDYGIRIRMGNMMFEREISESFNTLAGELENTELLRSDFVNNFSHEFKTPIVSIRGFARLLQKGNLSPDQQKEYLDIIVNESARLADMATNVLNLTKVENQSILTDVTRFNLSEQIRGCVLLLEKKWTKKKLEMNLNFGEFTVSANEELLKQVWINLLDNAVKFSAEGGEIGISIRESEDELAVSITNGGQEISSADRSRIFQKFYQGDTSHTGEGNGIGLAVVKRVTELHGGTVAVSGSPGETVFTVRLPKCKN